MTLAGGQGIRGLLQPFLRSAAEQGLSFAQMERQIRPQFPRLYRRTEMLADYREHRHVERSRNPLLAVRRDYYPSDRFAASPSRFMARDRAYSVKVDYYSRVEGRWKVGYTRVSTNQRLTKQQVEDLAASYYDDAQERESISDVRVTLWGMYIRPGR